jgi:hypothetical protein
VTSLVSFIAMQSLLLMPIELDKSVLELSSLQTKTFVLATLIRKRTIQRRSRVLLAGPESC